MSNKTLYAAFVLTVIFILCHCIELKAELNFDFALPLFKENEVNFEKTKATDYNLQILKKYILEREGKVLSQFHAITRWFTLIKLSDRPRQAELLESGSKYFSTKNKNKADVEEKLREVFYKGILLSVDKKEDPDNQKDQEFEELLLDLEEELQENPNYWIAKGIIFQALKNRPNNYFNLMKPEEDFKRALSILPQSAQYYYVMGQCFRYLGNNDSTLFLSIASYEKAASLDPRNPKLQNSLLGIYMGLHEEYQSKGKREPFWLEEAVYKKILEVSPKNPHALNNLGYLYAEYGVNAKTALELCKRAIELSPENPGFYDSLGWAAFKNRNFQLAEESLKKSIALRNNVYESHYHLATVYYSQNKYDEAAEQYEIAIKLKPDSAEALNNLAYLYTEQNRKIPEALAMAKKANNLEPNNASYLDTLGWAYYRSGDLDKALTYLLKADSVVPAQGEILLHIGRVYLDQNQFDKALAYTKEAFKASPGINDPDETLYLTIRLKAQHEAIANYHSLLGEKADKNKILNMLMAISKLYQEEGLFEKAIEITQICSDLKSGTKNLKEPLLNSYELYLKDKKENRENADSTVKEEKAKPATLEPKGDKQSNLIVSTGIKLPLAVSFCPELFERLSNYLPKLKPYSGLNITIFVDSVLFPISTAVVRVESDKKSTNELQDSIIKMFSVGKSKKINSNKLELLQGTYYVETAEKAVYFSQKPISQELIKELSKVLPFNKTYLMELFFDWEELKKRLPLSLSNFMKNPIAPFIRLQSSYSYSDDNLNEFITATTGKEENEDFMKKIAKKLLDFKLRATKKRISTTIKLQQEKNIVFISTDFEEPVKWVKQQVYSFRQLIRSMFFPVLFRKAPMLKPAN